MRINDDENLEIVRMQVFDIDPVLEILNENKLENWRYEDFVSELARDDSLILLGKINKQVVVFGVMRLIMHPDTIYLSKGKLRNYKLFNNLISTKIPNSKTSKKYETECEIYNIGVKREFQNRKIGSRLLSKLAQILENFNTEFIWLEVRASNEKAINFYRKNGFREIYQRKNFYSNPNENAIVMNRNLQNK